jgi:hypothetical protein
MEIENDKLTVTNAYTRLALVTIKIYIPSDKSTVFVV